MKPFIVLALAAVVAVALPPWPPAAAAERPPNIVYILLDDAGYGDLSLYGQEHFETPHMDRIGLEGIKFTQHYSGSTVCAPTRSVLITGLHTGRTPIRGNREVQPVGQSPLPADAPNFVKLLRENGYATGAFGKWGLGIPGSTGAPTRQGFDRFFGYICQRNAHTYYPTWLFDNDEQIELDGKTYSQDPIMEQALEFIREHHEQPFFCYLPMLIPHAAMQVPEPYAAPFREQFAEHEDKIGRYAGTEVRNPAAKFAGMMTRQDQDVGRVLALLEELGIEDHTVVMLSSDNGPHREGGHMPGLFNSGGDLRGFKRDLYEGGIRVPMVVRWPGVIEPGRVTDHISAQWDIFPTVCDIAGIEPPAGLDGISFLPTLTGEVQQQLQHEFLYWEFHEQRGRRAVRFGPWKAIQQDLADGPDTPIELYNLDQDRGERHDLAADHPNLVEQARQLFEDAHTPSPIWRFSWQQGG